MAKGDPLNQTKLSWTAAKKILSQADIERLACAMLNTDDLYKFDVKAAAQQYGSSKPESFRRQIWVIAKSVKAAMDSGDLSPSETPQNTPQKNQKNSGGKRKAGLSLEEDDESPTPRKSRKGKAQDAVLVKSEEGDDAEGSEDGFNTFN